MNCKDIEAALPEYLENSLDPASREEIRKHLESCEKCRIEAEKWAELLQVMDAGELEQPSPAVRENFQSLLQSELNLQATAGILKEGPTKKNNVILSLASPVWKAAAAIVLLLGGVWIGTWVKSPKEAAAPEQISALRKEVKEMKEMVLFSLLDDESASQRLKAVSYAEEIPNPDHKVIDALVSTLNNDKNVNVRLAALYSLARFIDNAAVRDSLITSLKKQTEPLIQVVLINMLAEKKETRAIAPIREILSRDKTMKEVKEAAQKSLKTL
jgi:hypothetical protein